MAESIGSLINGMQLSDEALEGIRNLSIISEQMSKEVASTAFYLTGIVNETDFKYIGRIAQANRNIDILSNELVLTDLEISDLNNPVRLRMEIEELGEELQQLKNEFNGFKKEVSDEETLAYLEKNRSKLDETADRAYG
mgnify:CR=1 FL=1